MSKKNCAGCGVMGRSEEKRPVMLRGGDGPSLLCSGCHVIVDRLGLIDADADKERFNYA